MVPDAIALRIQAQQSWPPSRTNHEKDPTHTPYLINILDAMDDSTLRRVLGMGLPLQEKDIEKAATALAVRPLRSATHCGGEDGKEQNSVSIVLDCTQ